MNKKIVVEKEKLLEKISENEKIISDLKYSYSQVYNDLKLLNLNQEKLIETKIGKFKKIIFNIYYELNYFQDKKKFNLGEHMKNFILKELSFIDIFPLKVSIGDTFNEEIHEVINFEKKIEKNKILKIIKEGFKDVAGKVIIFPKVIVSN